MKNLSEEEKQALLPALAKCKEIAEATGDDVRIVLCEKCPKLVTLQQKGKDFDWEFRTCQECGGELFEFTERGDCIPAYQNATFQFESFDANRKFDGPLQSPSARPPIKDKERFYGLIEECSKLQFAAMQAIEDADNGEEKAYKLMSSALDIANELVAMEPLRGIPWDLKASCLTSFGRLSEALDACKKAIEIDPSDPRKWSLMAHIHDLNGNSAEAEEAKKEAAKLS